VTAAADVAVFVERMRRERTEQGLPPTITDEATLRLIAAVVGRKRGADDRAA
jgi:hypothetical protein